MARQVQRACAMQHLGAQAGWRSSDQPAHAPAAGRMAQRGRHCRHSAASASTWLLARQRRTSKRPGCAPSRPACLPPIEPVAPRMHTRRRRSCPGSHQSRRSAPAPQATPAAARRPGPARRRGPAAVAAVLGADGTLDQRFEQITDHAQAASKAASNKPAPAQSCPQAAQEAGRAQIGCDSSAIQPGQQQHAQAMPPRRPPSSCPG
jgi:hypothetical protein